MSESGQVEIIMGTKGDSNRQRIIEAADDLFYTRGYNQTSFRDISDKTGIPRGNFYYYFKTKDDILGAVVDSRLTRLRDAIEQCESSTSDPEASLKAFVSNIIDKEKTLQFGCSIGTMSSELAKDEETLHKVFAVLFDEMRGWMRGQFDDLGCQQPDDLAMELLSKMQGAAVVSCAFKDNGFLDRSIAEMQSWVGQQVQQPLH